MNSDAGLVTGEFFQDHPLVAYQSQGQGRTLDLQYSSLQALPQPVVQFEPSTQPGSDSTAIRSVSAGVAVGGVSQGAAVTYNTPAGLSDGQAQRVPLQADATALATGVYPYSMNVTENYGGGPSMSAPYNSSVNVVNASASPYGAGWSIGGLQHVYAGPPTGPVLVTAGSQGTERFGYQAAGPVNDLTAVQQVASTDPMRPGFSYNLQVQSNDGMGDFTAGSGTTTVPNPVALAAGDFNGDGRSDLASVSGSAVSVSLASASGGFTAGGTYTLAASASAVLAGNFTGHANGVLDLAVLENDGTVAVLPGVGDGTFGAAAVTTVGGGATTGVGSMAAGDFNGDGKLDLAVATTGDRLLRVLPGNGNGTFGAATAYSSAGLVAAGDLTGDGKLDLAVVDDTTLYLMAGDGAGGFTRAGTYTVSSLTHPGFTGLTLGDFYGNGQLDAAVVTYDTQSGVAIVPGSPSGSWGNSVFYPSVRSGATVNELTAADLNGDGKPDLILADGTGPVQVLLSNPDANQMGSAFQVGTGTQTLVAVAPFTGRALPRRYAAPMGDTSTLARNPDGTWTRSYADGAALRFDAAGREVSEADRNGNATAYAYVAAGPAAGALQTVTDPVGLVTTLAYDASGRLSTVTDPAGRVTRFTVDASGNLTGVTDPDGAVTGYGYATPANHRVTTEVNPDGRTATARYDGFGRLTSETLFDGTSTTTVGGGEEKGLLAPGGSGALPTPGTYQGAVTDPDGHATTLTFDAMGHPSASTDAAGKTTTITRDMMTGWPTAVTDPLNRTTSYAYDMKGNVTQVTRPDTSVEMIAYDPNFGQPTQVTDFRNLVTTFTLDTRGNVLRRTDPDLGHEDFTYNAAGQVLTDTDRNGNTTSYAYNSLGRLTTITYPGAGSPAVQFGYDTAGDVTSVTDELNHVTTYTFDAAGRVLTGQDPVEAAAGKTTAYAYDPAGNLTRVTDPLNHVTTFAYDARDRLTSVVDPVNQGTGRQTSYGYDALGNLTSATDPLGHATTYAYDLDNRPTTVTDPLSHATTTAYDDAGQPTGLTDANGHTTAYAYDALGRLQSTTRAGLTSSTTYGYDADGNLTSVTDPLGDSRSYAYDALNRLTSATRYAGMYGTNPLTTTYGYDAVGNRITVTDGLNHTTTSAYDARDRLVSVTDPAGGGTTTYAYDAHSRLASLTDPVNNVTSWGYDANNRATTETDPRGKVTTDAYDVAGNRTQKTDRDGRVTQYGYDADNRPTTETWVGASPANTATTTYDAAGRVTGVQDASSTYAFGYDAANRPTTADDLGTPDLPRVILTSGYDPAGNRTSLTDGLGGVNGSTYDVRDELTSLTQSGTGVTPKRADFAYDAAGRRTSLTRYSDLAGATTVLATAYAYDAADRLTSLTHETALTGGTVVASSGYTLDNADRLTSESRTWNGGASTDTVGYAYTDNGQLTGVTHTNAAFANEVFGYDANGNRNTTGYSTTTGNRLAGDGTYTYAYDDEGNLVSKTQVSNGNQTLYTWDYRNRLTGVDGKVGGVTTSVARYTYDALNRRIGVVEGGSATWTVYDGSAPVLDFNASGTQTARYLQGPAVDEVLARETAGGTVAWYLADRLGTVRDVVNNTGAVIDHVDYGAYGTPTETNPGAGDRFKFAGLEYDPATGLTLAVHRVLLSPAGIWTSLDPWGFGGGDPNLYRYVNNGPSNSTDPYGLSEEPVQGMTPSHNRPRPKTPPTLPSGGPKPTPPGGESCDQNGGGQQGAGKGPRFHPDGTRKEPGKQKEEFEKFRNGPRRPGYYPQSGRTDQLDQKELDDLANEAIKGNTQYAVVCVGAAYVTYRIIRFIPSLIPALWPTIPANVAIP